MTTRGKITLLMAAWIVWIGCVVVGELLPAWSAPMILLAETHISDKLLHFGSYLGIALVPAVGWGARRGALTGGCAIVLGIALEFIQRMVPGRSYDIRDMLANAGGVLTGLLAGLAIRAMLSSSSARQAT